MLRSRRARRATEARSSSPSSVATARPCTRKVAPLHASVTVNVAPPGKLMVFPQTSPGRPRAGAIKAVTWVVSACKGAVSTRFQLAPRSKGRHGYQDDPCHAYTECRQYSDQDQWRQQQQLHRGNLRAGAHRTQDPHGHQQKQRPGHGLYVGRRKSCRLAVKKVDARGPRRSSRGHATGVPRQANRRGRQSLRRPATPITILPIRVESLRASLIILVYPGSGTNGILAVCRRSPTVGDSVMRRTRLRWPTQWRLVGRLYDPSDDLALPFCSE